MLSVCWNLPHNVYFDLQIWLAPKGLPQPEALTCGHCGKPMVLLAQIYAPVDDDVVSHADAFHRMLYVFTCVHAKCVNVAGAGGHSVSSPNVVVLRCQLPRSNSFYATDATATSHPYQMDTSLREDVCLVCGGPGPQRCGRCKGPRYCSRAHQLVHWKHGHAGACGKPANELSGSAEDEDKQYRMSVLSGSMLPEWGIRIDSEPSLEERREAEEAALPDNAAASLKKLKAKAKAAAAKAKAAANGGAGAGAGSSSDSSKEKQAGEGKTGEAKEEEKEENLPLKGLTQKELSETTGARIVADETMQYFNRRISCAPSQMLRYCRWPESESDSAASNGSGGGDSSSSGAQRKQREADAAAAIVAASGEVEEDDDEDSVTGGQELLGAPLWVSDDHKLPSSGSADAAAEAQPQLPPPCSRCGAPRRFEFQILPQALQYVLPGGPSRVVAGPEVGLDLEFGTIAIYTCTASCARPAAAVGHEQYYTEEWAWVQPEIEERVKYELPEGPAEGEEEEGEGEEEGEESRGGAKAAAAADAAATTGTEGPSSS